MFLFAKPSAHRAARIAFAFILAGFLSACQTTQSLAPETDASPASKHSAKPTYFIYLAGPEVFLPEPAEAGKKKKALIQALNAQQDWPFELVGLYPLDNEIADFGANFQTGMKIYQANIDLMLQADFVTANMVRFRGPSMDVGTAFEMGFMAGLEKPVFAYYDAAPFYGNDEIPGLYKDRVKQHYPVSEDGETDVHGQSIEDFQMADNLMMIGALQSGKGAIAYSFEAAVLQIAEHLLQQQTSTAD